MFENKLIMTKQGDGELRVNLGCGSSPTKGWVNIDNSSSVRLARFPRVVRMLRRLGVASLASEAFANSARNNGVIYANAAKCIPLASSSVAVVYSSHMLEHLDRTEALALLHEVHRVLIPGGVIRLVVPDLLRRVRAYVESGDADAFVSSLNMGSRAVRVLAAKIQFMAIGSREHQWMYDAKSLIRLLESADFADAREMQPGSTSIPNPGFLNLSERADESIYIEARRDQST
jgi:predicted SAM-dependent methyltransferase